MQKIIQIATDVDGLYCLTVDGKVYQRLIKDKESHTKKTEVGHKAWITGVYYWKEIPEEEKF